MAIHLKGFAGETPRTAPRYLDQQNAERAENVRLSRGDLEPINIGPVVHTVPGAQRSIYKHGDEWLALDYYSTRVAPGPVAGDRLYITSYNGGPRPKLRVGGQEYDLRLPAPVSAPVLVRNGTLEENTKELVIYGYTWLTGFGEESQISPTGGIFWSEGTTIELRNMPGPPAGRNITKKRIYRSQTTAAGETEFFFVAEIPASTAVWTHDINSHPLQEAITTKDFDPPPNNMVGITAMPNGMMAAFSGREVLFCEPYQPHAWPAKYRLTVNADIVALAAFGSSLAILTNGMPYVAQGLHPEAMAMEQIEQPYPCLAADGVVDMGYAAIYPSTEGLVEVSQNGARLISEGLWSKRLWDDMRGKTFRAAQFAGQYVFSHFPAGATRREVGLVNFRGQVPFYSRADINANNLFQDQTTGSLFILNYDGTIVEFDPSTGGSALTYKWKSRPFFSGYPQAFGSYFVEATSVVAGSEVIIYGDGDIIARIPHTSFNRVARGVAGRWNEVWAEARGSSSITRISAAQSPNEARQ